MTEVMNRPDRITFRKDQAEAAHATFAHTGGGFDEAAHDAHDHTGVPGVGAGGGGITNDAPDGSIAVSDGTNITGSADLTWDQETKTLGIDAEENGEAVLTALGVGSLLLIRAADGDEDHVGGELFLTTGNSEGQSSGDMTLSTGSDPGGGDSGGITIQTGAAADGQGGNITLYANGVGNAAVGGRVYINGGTGQAGSGGNVSISGGPKVTGGSHGNVQIYSGDGGTSIVIDSDGISVTGLPSADPEVEGALFTLGAPAPGVAAALMVSGGPA
jgi:hypothetical protein